jgi:predicted RNA-binding protein
LFGEISNFLRGGGYMMVDSGVFESYWRNDKKWTFKMYSKSLLKTDFDFYFAYDILPDKLQKKDFLEFTKRYIIKSSKINTKGHCIPIFHARDPRSLLHVMKNFLTQYPDLEFVSVTEKECGYSFLERANTIRKIRTLLNNIDHPTVLHILGCGNPISIATYSYCGADTFDSLGWGRYLIEPLGLRIYDISQLELLKCTCKICQKTQVDSKAKALLHNLLFYQKYIIQIQKMIRENTLKDFLLEFIGKENLKSIENPNI